MAKVASVCFWIVGRSVVIDLHAEDGSLIRPGGPDESYMVEIPATSQSEREFWGRLLCSAIAHSHGLNDAAVVYDADSTEFFTN